MYQDQEQMLRKTHSIVMLDDSVHLYVAYSLQDQQTKHPAYSLYLLSRDFHVFWSLKKALEGHVLISDSIV